MSAEPIIRDLTDDDIPQAIRLTEETWYTENDYPQCTEEKRHVSAVLCASYYISKTTYARACEMGGCFVGLLFGRTDGGERLFNIDLDVSAADKGMLEEARIIGRANDLLYERCTDRGYDCELLLYITDGRVRGKGIGSALMNDYLAYLRSIGKKRMYLYTNDYCNTGFYLKRGFSIDGTENVMINGAEHDIFIFSCDV